MGINSGIAWCDHTVNFWMGCEAVSEGCAHCYAKRWWMMAKLKPGERRRVSQKTIETTLGKAKPGDRVFVNSLSDFFDPKVPYPWRWAATEMMIERADLIFLLLTKRPEYIADPWAIDCRTLEWDRRMVDNRAIKIDHIHLGVTVENEPQTKRIAELLKIAWPGKLFVSMEPLLGAVNTQTRDYLRPAYVGGGPGSDVPFHVERGLDWVIVGGESGAKARPMKAEWARSLRDQCVQAGVPFFFKQWGGKGKDKGGRVLDGRTWDETP